MGKYEIGEFDLLAVLCEYLHEKLDVPVSTVMPDNLPPEFCAVYRIGGGRTQIRYDLARVTIETWAETEEAAFSLMAKVRRAMDDLPGLYIEVLSIDENTVMSSNDPNFPDRFCYEGIYNIFCTI